MPDFNVRDYAEVSPTQCVLCSTSTGPFVDCNSSIALYGRVYVCLGTDENPGCAAQMARAIGYGDPAHRIKLENELAETRAENTELRGRLMAVPHLVSAFDAIDEAERSRLRELGAEVTGTADPNVHEVLEGLTVAELDAYAHRNKIPDYKKSASREEKIAHLLDRLPVPSPA